MRVILTGRRIGMLKVLSFAGFNKWHQSTWLCRCKCGTEKVITGSQLLHKRTDRDCANTRSCGVCAKPRGRSHWHFKHGASAKGSKLKPLWICYRGMVDRCRNPNNGHYKDYGGRGIVVCDRWSGPDGFIHFIEDMAPRPKHKSLDRINVQGNYEPSNCRWATDRQQVHNRRTSYTPEELAELKKRADEVAEMNVRIAAEDAELNPF